MQRRIVCAAVVAVLSNSVSAQTSKAVQTARDFYRDHGTYLSQTIGSDPRGSPYGNPPVPSMGMNCGAVSPGMGESTKRATCPDAGARAEAEQDWQNNRWDKRREPALKFNMPPPEMPTPNVD